MEENILFLLSLFVVFALRIAIILLVLVGFFLVVSLTILLGYIFWKAFELSREDNNANDEIGMSAQLDATLHPSNNAEGIQLNPPSIPSSKPDLKYWSIN